MTATRKTVSEIATQLGRHPSTIYREVKRNTHYDEHPPFRGYYHMVAHNKARRRRVRGGKIVRDCRLATYVVDRLRACWSPEQISGYLRSQRQHGFSACPETIYQYVYGAHGRQQDLWRTLPCARKKRRRRYARKPRGLQIPIANTIAARPTEIAQRASFGHWAKIAKVPAARSAVGKRAQGGDLIAFRKEYDKANLTSLVERCSRYTVLRRNPSRHSAGVMAGIEQGLRPLPPYLRRSLTFDRGTEFSSYDVLKQKLGVTRYSCQTSAPW